MEDLKPKKVSESAIDFYPHEIFPNDLNPNDLNPRGMVFGGKVLLMIDNVAGIVAQRHSRRTCVTAELDSVVFLAPAFKGETLILKAALNRVWSSSMEIGVKIFAENFRTGESRHVVSAYLTFVALGEDGHKIKINPVEPETEDEKRRFREADERRIHRLKIKAEKSKK